MKHLFTALVVAAAALALPGVALADAYVTAYGGANWSAVNQGPANVAVDELTFLSDSTNLLAATHAEGLVGRNRARSFSERGQTGVGQLGTTDKGWQSGRRRCSPALRRRSRSGSHRGIRPC